MLKRFVCAILIIAVILSVGATNTLADSDYKALDANDAVISTNQIGTNSNSSYDSYIKDIPSYSAKEEVVSIPLNTDISEKAVDFNVTVEQDALYELYISYKSVDEDTADYEVSLKADDKSPFDEAEKLFLPRVWKDDGENRKDGMGNEFSAEQVQFTDYQTSAFYDITRQSAEKYAFYLEKGSHKISFSCNNGTFNAEKFLFSAKTDLKKYDSSVDSSKFYDGEPIVIEGEQAYAKNSRWLVGKSDNSSLNITPSSAVKSLVNYIGSDNWKTNGETVVWKVKIDKAGYYKVGFSFRQSGNIGAKTYREMKIDGKVPFKEASAIGFKYSYDWQQTIFEDDKENPYLVYLSEGEHEIALTVVSGEISKIIETIKEAVSQLGDLYIDMTMITGETVDIYRDYDLFTQIPDMKKRLKSLSKNLGKAADDLAKASEEKSGSNISVINNMKRVVDNMLSHKFTAHRYKSDYYTRYTSLASLLYELQQMPLDLDKIILASPKDEDIFNNANVFSKAVFSVEKFLVSFTQDYNNISGDDSAGDSITIWVNWGRDQAQVLNSLISTSFTPKTGTKVNVQLVNASIIQAILSGKGPDCILQHSRSEPVNLAMRGVLYNLSEFDDLDDVLKRFQDGAETPYYYKGGLYALPDTQNFFMMFVRTDIFKELGLPIPKTWNEFRTVVDLLALNNFTVWMPNNTATSTAQADAGIGSINLFPTFLLQKNLKIYKDDGKSTTLTSSDVMIAFEEWTNYYRKMKVPKTLDFYNRFRTGITPIGISNYTMYTTLNAAASELNGLWSMYSVPGTVCEDGSINNTTSGSGSACAILKQSSNPEAAWEFLKWWTSADTQLSFSNEVESILGPTGRMSVANVEAFSGMNWDSEMKSSILEAWSEVEEIPEYPGSYYVSRSVYHSFWNVVDNNQNPKDMLLKYGKEADEEIARKWRQYENR